MNVGNPFSAIPEEMRLLPNWVLWRFEDVGRKKPTKKPYQINGYGAGPINPAHWTTFEAAFNALQMGGYDGLGFVFTNTPYTGIDLDDCSFIDDKDAGELIANPNYQVDLDRQINIFREFDSYSERSPSGKGCHIIVKGEAPSGTKRLFIELYSTDRFFTMTGNVCNDKPIQDRHDMLQTLWQQMGGEVKLISSAEDGPETITDDEVLALARKHNAAVFAPLELADFSSYQSQSEADQAYMNIVGYYTNNRAQVQRIYGKSKLSQTDAKRKDKRYLNRTVNTAFDQKLPTINTEELTKAFEAKLGKSKKEAAKEIVNVYPPGLMGDIAQFIYSSSTKPVFEVALAGAIGLMAGMCGRAYNYSGTGLNQYVLLLAKTGRGKEGAAEGIDRLMSAIKMQVPTSTNFIGPSEISSGSALFKYLGNQSQSFVSLLGEFGFKLQQLTSPRANSAEITLKKMLLDLYNKSGAKRVLPASAYSKKEDSTNAVASPAFSILAESTPHKVYKSLNEDMITDGFLPRFLLIEYHGIRVPNNPNHNLVPIPFILIERLASLAAQCETINHSNPRRVVDVQATAEAAKALEDIELYATSVINSDRNEVISELWNRASVKLFKLAALVAVGENMLEPIITINNVNWAMTLIERDINTIIEKFESGEIGENTNELQQKNEIIRIAREYAEKGFDYVSKYKANAKMHHDKVISHTYLSLRLTRMAAFRTDRIGGLNALKRTIQLLVDNGKLVLVSGPEVIKKYSTTEKAYYIHPSILD